MTVKWFFSLSVVALSIFYTAGFECAYDVTEVGGGRHEGGIHIADNSLKWLDTLAAAVGDGLNDPDRQILVTLILRAPQKFIEIDKSLLISPAPNELRNNFDFRVEVISRSGKIIGIHGFDDPRFRHEEPSYQGPVKVEEIEFDLVLPLYYEIDRAEIRKKDSGKLLHVIDLQKFYVKRQ